MLAAAVGQLEHRPRPELRKCIGLQHQANLLDMRSPNLSCWGPSAARSSNTTSNDGTITWQGSVPHRPIVLTEQGSGECAQPTIGPNPRFLSSNIAMDARFGSLQFLAAQPQVIIIAKPLISEHEHRYRCSLELAAPLAVLPRRRSIIVLDARFSSLHPWLCSLG